MSTKMPPQTASNVVALDPLRAYLAEHADYGLDPHASTDKNLDVWLAELNEHRRAGARTAYLVGRVLRAHRPQHGKVAAWEQEQAARLSRSARSVRLYMQVAEAIDADLATPLPISVLDRPLREVPRAIRNVRVGRDADTQPKSKPKVGKVQQWKRRAKNLLRSIPRGTSRKALLEEYLRAVYHELLKLDPGLARIGGEQDGHEEQTTFALAVAQQLQKGRPLPLSVLKARKKVQTAFAYPGGKSHVASKLMDAIGVLPADGLWGDHVFREPFTGGGSVALNMLATGRTKRVWLNDLEPGVVALWNAIIHDHRMLIRRVTEASVDLNYLLALRADYGARVLTGLDLAWAELVLRHCGHNGITIQASSLSRARIAQWSPNSVVRRVSDTHFLLAGRVEHGECTSMDACEVIAVRGPCFIYADPPYVERADRLYRQPFVDEDHSRLAAALRSTDQPWLLSYRDHPLVRKLYESEVIERLVVPRPTGGSRKPGNDRPAHELLICPQSHADILRPADEPEEQVRRVHGPVSAGVSQSKWLRPDRSMTLRPGKTGTRPPPFRPPPRSCAALFAPDFDILGLDAPKPKVEARQVMVCRLCRVLRTDPIPPGY